MEKTQSMECNDQETAKRYDPTFKKRFGIRTPILYAWDLVVEPKNKVRIQRAWRRFYKSTEPTGSKRRRARFEAFFNRLHSAGDDLAWCQKVTISYLGRKVGYGVIATEDIPPNEILNHYAGYLRPDADISAENDSTFALDDFKNYSIDAMHQGNWARFMNHAPEEETNVTAWEHYAEFGPRIIFTAGKKGVKKGEQLLYSYGEDYWEARKPLNLLKALRK
ncbi:MAG: hypothetical protein K940chlam2_01151 [Chlamydiae bacterium]|nr:hypothetical protein [Chlamydiota bacterium]